MIGKISPLYHRNGLIVTQVNEEVSNTCVRLVAETHTCFGLFRQPMEWQAALATK